MFYIGFFSSIIPYILLGLGSISMLYWGNSEKIDNTLLQILALEKEQTIHESKNSTSTFIAFYKDNSTKKQISTKLAYARYFIEQPHKTTLSCYLCVWPKKQTHSSVGLRAPPTIS